MNGTGPGLRVRKRYKKALHASAMAADMPFGLWQLTCPMALAGGIADMPMRKEDGFWESLDKNLTWFLRYGSRRGEARLEDVARELNVREDEVLDAVGTMTHPRKGRRYWSGTYQNQIWVGVNWWPGHCGEEYCGHRWAGNIVATVVADNNAGETSVWPPLGGQYFGCPNQWARKEGEGLVEYIQKWFVWERDCPRAEVLQAWNRTASLVEERAIRGRSVTFHAGPRGDCAAWMRTVDVHEVYRVEGVPSGLDARAVTGMDKRCLKHLMKQEIVADVVRRVVMMVENDGPDEKEFAVVCQYGKHRSVAVVMLVLACVYYNAVVGFHNKIALQVARGTLDLCPKGSGNSGSCDRSAMGSSRS